MWEREGLQIEASQGLQPWAGDRDAAFQARRGPFPEPPAGRDSSRLLWTSGLTLLAGSFRERAS